MESKKNKLLGKYSIVEEKSANVYICSYNKKSFEIRRQKKDEKSEILLNQSKELNHLSSHKNISVYELNSDEEWLYFIREKFENIEPLNINFFKNYNEDIRSIKLLDCYIQILEAIEHIDKKKFYHGNISPETILVDENNIVYILDFGKSYYFEIKSENNTEVDFHAPEQLGLEKGDAGIHSDIFSFGLCMLKMLLESFGDSNFNRMYSSDNCDLDQLSNEITSKYDFSNLENKLFLLILKMCKRNPKNRISLDELRKELISLQKESKKNYCYEINFQSQCIEKYANNHDIPKEDFIETIQDKIKNRKSYWLCDKDNNGKERIRISIYDLVFYCSVKQESSYLFCFYLSDRPEEIEHLSKVGEENDCNFKITEGNEHNYNCDNVSDYRKHIIDISDEKIKINERREINQKSIETEKALLDAEEKNIEEKKNTQIGYLDGIKSNDIISFRLKDEVQKEKQFKPKQKVIVELINPVGGEICQCLKDSVKGEIDTYNPSNNLLKVKIGEYEHIDLKDNFSYLNKKTEFSISYDYEVEEILWSKKKKALDDLAKGTTAIPDLLKKISNPEFLNENELTDMESFFNEQLDEDQKNAIQKAISLDKKSEILLIQGPPGTGKTTVITEIVEQYHKKDKTDKILVVSQSNQAVDNVLEKICMSEGKLLRIGNDSCKISKKGQDYRPEEVLNKIIKDNISRINENPFKDADATIQAEMQELQKEFKEALQKITSKMSLSKKSKKRDKDFGALFTKNISIIFGTLLGISSWKNFKEMNFDVIIVDEAGRATLSELLVPCLKGKKLILVGDHKQLSPMVDDEIAEHLEDNVRKSDVTVSLFESMFEKMDKLEKDGKKRISSFKHTLIYNYRAHETICDVYSKTFYEGKIKTKPEINENKLHKINGIEKSVIWIDTGELPNRADKQKGTGKENPCHIEIIKDFFNKYKPELKNHISDIGVITPYKAQEKLLKTQLRPIVDDFKKSNICVDIGTVDSFQGSDRDVIIYDCVRSSLSKNNKVAQKNRCGHKIDFIANEKRLNVSLSRSKKLLVIIGDLEYLETASVSENENPFKEIIELMKKDKRYKIIKVQRG